MNLTTYASKSTLSGRVKNALFFMGAYLVFNLFFCSSLSAASSRTPTTAIPKDVRQQYIDFFEQVYAKMDQEYYLPVKREAFDRFIKKFEKDIYGKMADKNKSSDFIRWRSAAFLVDYLKSPDDIFSAFFPPKPAKEFEQKVLGQKVDLGIEGRLAEQGFLITRIEPRSDAFMKGMREEDIIQKIGDANVLALNEERIKDLLTPLIDTIVSLTFVDRLTKEAKAVDVVSQEYFKQSVFMVPVDVPGVSCLEIKTFNRKTSEDMLHFLSVIEEKGDANLILDLRGNPGGPPLAAGEISGFFLPAQEHLAFFAKKDKPIGLITAAQMPEEHRFKGLIAILVNKESGSASELFSGVLQRKKRAVLIGTNTAGKVLLKSMYPFEDESMLLLVTARGHFDDGSVFDFGGLVPDIVVADEGADMVHFAAEYLVSKNK